MMYLISILVILLVLVFCWYKFKKHEPSQYFVIYHDYEKDFEAEEDEYEFLTSPLRIDNKQPITKKQAEERRLELLKDNSNDEGNVVMIVKQVGKVEY